MIRLGQKVVDVVTGFKGIVVARTEWLNGCVRVCVQPPLGKDGKHVDNMTFDEETLKVLDETPIALPNVKTTRKQTGGGRDDAAALRR